jgi:hypothetical protein
MRAFPKHEGFYTIGTVNTYNYENILSQVLQYTVFEGSYCDEEDSTYVILQTHNGCDVRGGYSTPHVFKVLDFDYFCIAQTDIYADCTGCRNYWISYDAGYHMWYDGCSANEKPFSEYTIKDEENNKVLCKDCGSEIVFSVIEGW